MANLELLFCTTVPLLVPESEPRVPCWCRLHRRATTGGDRSSGPASLLILLARHLPSHLQSCCWMPLRTVLLPIIAVVIKALTCTPPVQLRAMYSLATARTTRSATHAAASSPAAAADPSSTSSSSAKKRRAGEPADADAATGATPSKKPRATPKKKATKSSASPVGDGGSDGENGTADSKSRTTPKKFAAYLTTPYPDYARPTADECEEVTRLLGEMHGLPQRPGRVEKLKENGPVRVGEACESRARGLDPDFDFRHNLQTHLSSCRRRCALGLRCAVGLTCCSSSNVCRCAPPDVACA